jgi:hypothetical protein
VDISIKHAGADALGRRTEHPFQVIRFRRISKVHAGTAATFACISTAEITIGRPGVERLGLLILDCGENLFLIAQDFIERRLILFDGRLICQYRRLILANRRLIGKNCSFGFLRWWIGWRE